MTEKLKQIQQSKLEAEAKAAALRNERDALPKEIERLKTALLRDSKLDPETTRAEIQAKEERVKNLTVLTARAEGDILRAQIELARFPIDGYEREFEEAAELEEKAGQAVKQAQDAYTAAQQRVKKLLHDIETAQRTAQRFEIELSQHHSAARAALA